MVAGSKDPAIHSVGRLQLPRHLVTFTLEPLVILQEKLHHIPQGEQHILHNLLDTFLLECQGLCAHDWGIDEIQANGVCRVLVDDFHWVGVVLEGLGHLLAVLRQHKPIDDQVLEGGLAKQRRGQHQQCVEPSPGLIQPLCNKVCRECLVEQLLVLEGIMVLGIRHRSTLKPTVKHLLNAPQLTFTHFAGDPHVVQKFTMNIIKLFACQLFKLCDGADHHDLLPILRVPNWERRPPVPRAGHTPVPSVLQPVVEASRVHEIGHPIRGIGGFQKLILDGLNLHKPRSTGLVHQRFVGPPTEGITVDQRALVDHTAHGFDGLTDLWVCVFDVHALEVGHLVRVAAAGVHRA
mmetsp:Transcript_5240/g.9380  ORF Transcript_5240/g.9380 Transcript_5240/m.9380 type:complete len:349 (-) Transcript_5240:1205-2251(-)